MCKIYLVNLFVSLSIVCYSQNNNDSISCHNIDSVSIYFYPFYLGSNPELNKDNFIERSAMKIVYYRYGLVSGKSFYDNYLEINSIAPDTSLVGWDLRRIRSLYIYHFANGKQEKLYISVHLACQFEGREEIFMISEELLKEMHGMLNQNYLDFY